MNVDIQTQQQTTVPQGDRVTGIITQHLGALTDKALHGERWARDHVYAWGGVNDGSIHRWQQHERAISVSIDAWAQLAEAHEDAHGSPIGDDGVLGVAWADMGRALLTMLNGERGRLDGGSLDRLIREIALACNVTLE